MRNPCVIPRLKTGIELIAEKRAKHESKGFSAMHDDEHVNGELLDAALCLAHVAGEQNELPEIGGADWAYNVMGGGYPSWPWSREDLDRCLAPDNPIDNLATSGALIAAEIDRLLRINDRTVL